MNWFALYVKPQHEKSVAEQLEAKSVHGYVPFFHSKRRWSDRVKAIELPLFPRYVFARFSFEERLKVLSVSSVLSLVGFGGKPCPMSDEEIDRVKSMVDSGLPIMPWPMLRIGQRIRIHKGPLSGVEGVLVREKAAYRVVVNVDLLQRAVALEIDRDLLESGTPTRSVDHEQEHVKSGVGFEPKVRSSHVHN
ncbi:MAG: UpxY family transcription antiterminator [Acidobacteriaceae bacterium]|nr:UpxY family transcription antiterminator [Acidobacteriaceae bacterium]MBV9764459.1 UpxY family transcription antiterminator [Acidobacteriaceae bacterium]